MGETFYLPVLDILAGEGLNHTSFVMLTCVSYPSDV